MKNADLGARAPNPRPRRWHMTRAHDVEQRPETSARPATLDPRAPVMYEPGRCRVCGCTDEQACDLGAGFVCWWVDEAHTLCSAPRCLAVVPIGELEQEAGITAAAG